MAIISCPECRQMVSDAAKVCPKCGYPISGRMKFITGTARVLSKIPWRILKRNKKIMIPSVIIVVLIITLILSSIICGISGGLANNGNYKAAYNLLKVIPFSIKGHTLSEQLQYESVTLTWINSMVYYLKNPESLQISDITFYIYYDEEKDEYSAHCLVTYNAQNGFGGNNIEYSPFDSDNDYLYEGNCSSQDVNDANLMQINPYSNNFLPAITVSGLMSMISDPDEGDVVINNTIDLKRVNNIIKNDNYKNITLIEPDYESISNKIIG